MNILGFGTGIATLLLGADNTGLQGSLLNKDAYAQESVKCDSEAVVGNLGLDITAGYKRGWVAATVMHEVGTWANRDIITVKDTLGQAWVKVKSTTGNKYMLSYFDGSSFVDGSVSTYTDANALHRLDLQYEADAIRLYIDGTADCEIVASIPESVEDLATVELHTPITEAATGSYWSSVFIADKKTTKTIMNQHTIDADGTHHSDWVGSYTDVNTLATLGESTAINSEVGGTSHTFQKSALPVELTDGYSVTAVGLYSRVVENSDVVSQFQTVMTDGTNENLGELQAIPGVYTTLKEIEHTAQDGDFWTVEKLDAIEVGVKCVV